MSDPIEIPGPPKMPRSHSLDPRNPRNTPWWILAAALLGAGEMRAQVGQLRAEMDLMRATVARIEARLTPPEWDRTLQSRPRPADRD